MAYKVGSTVVINDEGKIDWAKITKPVEMTKGADVVRRRGSGTILASFTKKLVFDANGGYHEDITNTYRNCNCNCNCNCRC